MTTQFDSRDVEQNRVKGGLGYLVFFLPLFLCPQSKFGRFCANQGLLAVIAVALLWIAFGLVNMMLGWVPLLGGLLRVVGMIARAAVGIVCLYFTYLACARGDARTIPVIGSMTIIK